MRPWNLQDWGIVLLCEFWKYEGSIFILIRIQFVLPFPNIVQAGKLKKSLEAELLSLRERVSELEYESSLKTEEVASAAAGKEEALASSLAEITNLKEETSVKTWVLLLQIISIDYPIWCLSYSVFNCSSQVLEMEIQISAVKEDLEKEHQRWRSAQANYERQVICYLFNCETWKMVHVTFAVTLY